jgi:hypothetical protein
MTIPDIIALMEARIAYLSQQRATASSLGDMPGVLRIDADLAETELTLATLRAALNIV